MVYLWIYLGAINAATFIIWGWDKYQAIRHGRRISEQHLLRLCRAGGWIGALLGMEVWRHKTVKGAFLGKYLLIVAVWLVLLCIIGWRYQSDSVNF